MERSPLAWRILLWVMVPIGIGMIGVGFIEDADLVTFLGVFLVMVPFFARTYFESARNQHKSLEDV